MKSDYLAQLVNERKSIRQICSETGKSYASIRYWLTKFNLKTNSSWRVKEFLIDENILKTAVSQSTCLSEALRKLNVISNSSGNYSYATRKNVKNLIARFNISTNHFLGHAAKAGKLRPGYNKARDPFAAKTALPTCLRSALIREGRPYKCSVCGTGTYWNGKILKLQLDHIDGNRENNTRENLRFICPNCHSQQSTSTWLNVSKALLEDLKFIEQNGADSRT